MKADPSSDDALFLDLMKEFQRLDLPSPDLVRQVDRGQRKLVLGLGVGVVATTILCTAGLTKMVLEPRLESYVFGFLQIGFAISVMGFVLWSQRHAWSARAATTRAFLALELERSRDKIRRMWFLRVACPVLAGITLLWQALLFRDHPHLPLADLRAVVGFGTPYVVFAGMFLHAGRRRRQFARQADALVKRINDLDEVPPPML